MVFEDALAMAMCILVTVQLVRSHYSLRGARRISIDALIEREKRGRR
jgi:hypothetical protein